MDYFLGALIGGVIAALATWLVLRTRTATLQERLGARDGKIVEMESRLTEEEAAASLARIEATQARQELIQSQTQLVEARKAELEKLAILNEAQAKLSNAFQALSAEA